MVTLLITKDFSVIVDFDIIPCVTPHENDDTVILYS